MSENDGLICAFRIDGGGHSATLDWQEINQPVRDGSWMWVHLDRENEAAQRWLAEDANISSNTTAALLSVETRPRCVVKQTGTLLILRGVNLNPHADPEDMVAVRVWIEKNRIITVRRRKLMAMDQIRQDLAENTGPDTPGDFVVALATGLVERMEGVMDAFDEEVDTLETDQAFVSANEFRNRLAAIRHKMIPLRRYLAPQRDALSHLLMSKANWIDEANRSRLYEVADHVTRFVEDLDSARERTAIIHDSLTSQIAERMNQIMMVLSVVAAIFLPLGFLTGLLGINVGGIPGAENTSAFWLVTVALIAIGLLELALFRWLKWI